MAFISSIAGFRFHRKLFFTGFFFSGSWSVSLLRIALVGQLSLHCVCCFIYSQRRASSECGLPVLTERFRLPCVRALIDSHSTQSRLCIGFLLGILHLEDTCGLICFWIALLLSSPRPTAPWSGITLVSLTPRPRPLLKTRDALSCEPPCSPLAAPFASTFAWPPCVKDKSELGPRTLASIAAVDLLELAVFGS